VNRANSGSFVYLMILGRPLSSRLLENVQSDEKTRLYSYIDYGIQRIGC